MNHLTDERRMTRRAESYYELGQALHDAVHPDAPVQFYMKLPEDRQRYVEMAKRLIAYGLIQEPKIAQIGQPE